MILRLDLWTACFFLGLVPIVWAAPRPYCRRASHLSKSFVFFQFPPSQPSESLHQAEEEIDRAEDVIKAMIVEAWKELDVEPVYSQNSGRLKSVLLPELVFDGSPGDWTFNMILQVNLKGPMVCQPGSCTLIAQQWSGRTGYFDLTINDSTGRNVFTNGKKAIKVKSEERYK
ncbi:hypothetical protein C8J55DRAFT_135512 [Lentinula edodes]|uniref:Uncharacterized protein n=1 Tax=Lentinula lateritia TaxID=40482 RepID=A0A9W9DJ84_9AGAR|nr:hypothetical protein C8J55DRAFT_135512 [Lentinula edodes]